MSKLEIGQKLYATRNCLKKGIEEVTVTRIYKDNSDFFWDDNNPSYEYQNDFGCLLRALLVGTDAFYTREEAIEKAKTAFIWEIERLEIAMKNL